MPAFQGTLARIAASAGLLWFSTTVGLLACAGEIVWQCGSAMTGWAVVVGAFSIGASIRLLPAATLRAAVVSRLSGAPRTSTTEPAATLAGLLAVGLAITSFGAGWVSGEMESLRSIIAAKLVAPATFCYALLFVPPALLSAIAGFGTAAALAILSEWRALCQNSRDVAAGFWLAAHAGVAGAVLAWFVDVPVVLFGPIAAFLAAGLIATHAHPPLGTRSRNIERESIVHARPNAARLRPTAISIAFIATASMLALFAPAALATRRGSTAVDSRIRELLGPAISEGVVLEWPAPSGADTTFFALGIGGGQAGLIVLDASAAGQISTGEAKRVIWRCRSALRNGGLLIVAGRREAHIHRALAHVTNSVFELRAAAENWRAWVVGNDAPGWYARFFDDSYGRPRVTLQQCNP
ncbi:MAG: hypothetical protein U1D55_11395 [Phycisphaerae bacterium]